MAGSICPRRSRPWPPTRACPCRTSRRRCSRPSSPAIRLKRRCRRFAPRPSCRRYRWSRPIRRGRGFVRWSCSMARPAPSRISARAFSLPASSGSASPLTILVATSGDTGGAVGCAVEGRANLRALILYPKGRVSPFQAWQLGCWRPPVQALEVEGDFDDCQRLVKAAFADPGLCRRAIASPRPIRSISAGCCRKWPISAGPPRASMPRPA